LRFLFRLWQAETLKKSFIIHVANAILLQGFKFTFGGNVNPYATLINPECHRDFCEWGSHMNRHTMFFSLRKNTGSCFAGISALQQQLPVQYCCRESVSKNEWPFSTIQTWAKAFSHTSHSPGSIFENYLKETVCRTEKKNFQTEIHAAFESEH